MRESNLVIRAWLAGRLGCSAKVLRERMGTTNEDTQRLALALTPIPGARAVEEARRLAPQGR